MRSFASVPVQGSGIHAANFPSMSGAGGTVLVVDDEDAVRSVVGRMLERAGFTVVQARNGAEALQIGLRIADSIRLLVTDVRMPGMSGHELADAFSESHPEAAILLMTGFSDVAPADRPVLAKPFAPSKLLAAVKQVLEV